MGIFLFTFNLPTNSIINNEKFNEIITKELDSYGVKDIVSHADSIITFKNDDYLYNVDIKIKKFVQDNGYSIEYFMCKIDDYREPFIFYPEKKQ